MGVAAIYNATHGLIDKREVMVLPENRAILEDTSWSTWMGRNGSMKLSDCGQTFNPSWEKLVKKLHGFLFVAAWSTFVLMIYNEVHIAHDYGAFVKLRP